MAAIRSCNPPIHIQLVAITDHARFSYSECRDYYKCNLTLYQSLHLTASIIYTLNSAASIGCRGPCDVPGDIRLQFSIGDSLFPQLPIGERGPTDYSLLSYTFAYSGSSDTPTQVCFRALITETYGVVAMDDISLTDMGPVGGSSDALLPPPLQLTSSSTMASSTVMWT